MLQAAATNTPYEKAETRFPDCPIITGLVCCFPCCVPLTLWGLRIKEKPQTPFDADKVAADGGKYVIATDGRKVEYFVYGSAAKNAKVVVNCHGSGFSGKSEMDFYAPICEKLGVKGISISWGGHGNTDGQVGRQLKDWASTDLEPVLTEEGVDKFMITGHSSGNPHAMVAAWQFPERCIGLGLNAPFVSAPIVKEFGLTGAIGSDSLPTTLDLQKCHNSWYFAMMTTAMALPPSVIIGEVVKTNPKLKTDQQLSQWLVDAMTRGAVRGAGNIAGWESAFDVCYEWGFDPRDIQTKNVCVWHAADDHECPPEHGKWLADMFKGKGAKVNFKDDAVGYGHYTFYQGEFAEPGGSLVNALLA